MSPKKNAYAGRNYVAPSRDELLAMKEAKQRTMPNGEAGRREQNLLRHYGAAKDELQWIVDNNAWHDLGFDTFTAWYTARVRPAVAEGGLRPTQEFAVYVLENLHSDDAKLPKQQRLLQKELAELAGISVSTLRRLSDAHESPKIHPTRHVNAGADLGQATVADATGPDPADLADAVAQAIAEVASGSEWACENCNGKLTGPEWEGGRRRCHSCDPSGHHRALTVDDGLTADNDFVTDCGFCLNEARIAAETAAGAVTPVEPADAADVVVGGSEPDVGGLGPEELDEEEAATPPVVTPSHPSDSPAAVTDDTASQVVLQQPGADAPIPLGAPDGGGVDLPPPSLSGITSETEGVPWETADVDHRPAATGVSPVGREAPERPPLSVEPVLEDGGPAPALPSSSSDPVDALVGRFTQFTLELLQQTDPLVLGPLLHDDDLLTLRSVIAELDAYVGRLTAARTP